MIDRIRIVGERSAYFVQRRRWFFFWEDVAMYFVLEDAFSAARCQTAGTRQKFITLVDEKLWP